MPTHCAEIKLEVSEVFIQAIRIVRALLRLARDSKMLLSCIGKTAAHPADIHDFLKLDKFKTVELLGVIWTKQRGMVHLNLLRQIPRKLNHEMISHTLPELLSEQEKILLVE